MKKYLFFLILFVGFAINAEGQNRFKLSDGIYLVSYGNTAVIEDDNNQRSISISITQDGIDKRNKEKIYKVVCGKWTKRVVKFGINAAVAAGIAAAAPTYGVSLSISAAGKAAEYIYDDLCEYYGDSF